MNIFLIPARSGSVGIKDKNIQLINDQTLIQHAITFSQRCAQQTDKVYISTDSIEYERHALANGALSVGTRHQHLSDSKARTKDVIIDFFKTAQNIHLNIRNIILIQPTSPIRTKELFWECMASVVSTREVVTTIAKLEEPHPYKLLKLASENNRIAPFIGEADLSAPRQSLPKCYFPTGGIYIYPAELIKRGGALHATRGVLHNDSINIDTQYDLEIAQKRMSI